MRLSRLTLRTATAVMFLLLGVVSAQTTGDYHMQLVTGTGTSDSTTPPSITIATGSNGSAVINILPLNGFSQQVAFSCVGVPANGSCSFNPTTLTPDGLDPKWTTLTVATTATFVAQHSPVRSRWLLGSGLMLAGMFLVVPIGKRRKVAALLLLLTSMLLVLTVGCGGGSSASNQVAPGTYSILVNATSGSLTHSATLSVIVTK
jgi:hypothetical protein